MIDVTGVCCEDWARVMSYIMNNISERDRKRMILQFAKYLFTALLGKLILP